MAVPNMKTGFSLLNEAPKPDQDLLNYLNNLLVVFGEKSIEYGVHYAKCAGRDNLSGMDTLYGLQYLCHEFFNLPDLEECVRKQMEIENDSGNDSDCESGNDSKMESDSGNDSGSDSGSDKFTRASNDDPICKSMNVYHDEWDTWNPEDDIQSMLKRNVNNTIDRMKSD